MCQSKEACGKGYGSDLFSGRADAGAEVLPQGSPAALAVEAAAEAAADGVYYVARGLPKTGGENDEMANFRRRVSSGMSGVLAYEDAALQAKARAVLPPEGAAGGSILQKAAEMAAAGGFSEEEGLARALLRFVWRQKRSCRNVVSASVERAGNVRLANPFVLFWRGFRELKVRFANPCAI